VPILEGRGVSVAFGGLSALRGVDVAIEEREVVGLLGPNGSGKSTLFNVLGGLLRPTSGEVWFRGQRITGGPPWVAGRLGIGRTFQIPRPFAGLSVLDSVLVGVTFRTRHRYRRAADRRAEAERLLGLVGLADKADQPAREISHGEQRQLELAIALAAAPRVLLLDEPAAGLSPDETQKMVALVRGLKGRYTIVLIEHKMDIIMGVSDRVSVMHFGSLIAEGTPAEIQRNPEVRRAYLGGMVAE